MLFKIQKLEKNYLSFGAWIYHDGFWDGFEQCLKK